MVFEQLTLETWRDCIETDSKQNKNILLGGFEIIVHKSQPRPSSDPYMAWYRYDEHTFFWLKFYSVLISNATNLSKALANLSKAWYRYLVVCWTLVTREVYNSVLDGLLV